LCQTEAVEDITHGASERAMQIAQNQLNGTVSMKINSPNKDLLEILAKIERKTDSSDDEMIDEQTFSHDILLKNYEICEELKNLIRSNKYRSVINDGISIIILGEPNAGKSSLLNFLREEEGSIVSKIAGTTRDTVSEKIIIGSNTLKICDIAGLRNGEWYEIEKQES
jgi:tRNA modification GTPase